MEMFINEGFCIWYFYDPMMINSGECPLYWYVPAYSRCWNANRENTTIIPAPPRLGPGESCTVADVTGPGVIDYIWLSFDWPGAAGLPDAEQRSQAVWIECIWDDAESPAINAPVYTFFGPVNEARAPFENAFFANPVGRSYLCWLPMPFRRRAQVVIRNKFERSIDVYFDVRTRPLVHAQAEEICYLHAPWRCTALDAHQSQHEAIPEIVGRGRFIGLHTGIRSTLPREVEWHGGPLSVHIDQDLALASATVDDYCGSAWRYDEPYQLQDSGLWYSNYDATGGRHAWYCYHRRDPIYFNVSLSVSLTSRGGMTGEEWIAFFERSPEHKASCTFPVPLGDLVHYAAIQPNNWVLADRHDEIETVAFFYWEKP